MQIKVKKNYCMTLMWKDLISNREKNMRKHFFRGQILVIRIFETHVLAQIIKVFFHVLSIFFSPIENGPLLKFFSIQILVKKFFLTYVSMKKNFNKGPFSIGEKKIESTRLFFIKWSNLVWLSLNENLPIAST
jgi:hypothetical protein